jgi:hypothetical protein
MVDVVVGGSGEEIPNVESQLSEKAHGKKRMREGDHSDDKDDRETLEILFGNSEGSSSGASSSSNSSDRDGQPNRKRMKTDAGTDERINTDQSVANEWLSMIARLRFIRKSGWSQAKRLRETKKLHHKALLLD